MKNSKEESTQFNLHLRKIVAPAVQEKLLGFKKSGQTFRMKTGDVEQLVKLQTSLNSDGAHAYTINLGVLSIPIFEVKWPYDYKRTISDCHWKKRIGWYIESGHRDCWWTLRSEPEAMRSLEESLPLLEKGLEEMDLVSSTRKLLTYWESGEWGGLGAKEREMYVKLAQQVLSA